MKTCICATMCLLTLTTATLAAPPASAPASAGLSARIVIPDGSKLEKGKFAAALVLTNDSDEPIRVCTRCVVGNGMSKDGKFSYAHLTPDRWKSDPPSKEELARATVELAPGKSVSLPFQAVCKGPGKIELSAEYKVPEESVPPKQGIWTGRVEAKPVQLDVAESGVKTEGRRAKGEERNGEERNGEEKAKTETAKNLRTFLFSRETKASA